MTNPIWNDLDHRLSVIRRWGTAESVHKQSVAEHIFNVERLAVRMAKQWFDITDKEHLFEIARWAHHHEDFEALSGDFPTMVKPYFDESGFSKEHSDVMKYREPRMMWTREIVKLADMFDSWWFLCVEKSLGSTYLDHHHKHEPYRIMDYVKRTWPTSVELMKKVNDLIDDMSGEKSIRHSRRGR